MTGWRPDNRGVTPGGDCGGDHQAGDAYATGFRNDSLPHAVIIVSVYPVGSDGEWSKAPWRIETLTEYMICVDPDHPGDTETWSDNRYTTAPHPYRTIAKAAQAVEHIGQAYAAGRLLPDRSDWDGEPFQ